MSHSGLLSLLLRVPLSTARRFPWVLRRDDPWPECSKREDSGTFANWSWRWVWGSAYSTWRRIWSGYWLRICSWGPADLGRKVCPRSSSRPSARRRAWGDSKIARTRGRGPSLRWSTWSIRRWRCPTIRLGPASTSARCESRRRCAARFRSRSGWLNG